MHEHWRTEVWIKEAYELNYLAEFVDLRQLTATEKEYGLGRNCSLFDTVRRVNMMFSEPLPYSEIKAAAKSITKYCWKRDSYHYNEFIYRQTLKGSKGSKGGKVSKRKHARNSLG